MYFSLACESRLIFVAQVFNNVNWVYIDKIN